MKSSNLLLQNKSKFMKSDTLYWFKLISYLFLKNKQIRESSLLIGEFLPSWELLSFNKENLFCKEIMEVSLLLAPAFSGGLLKLVSFGGPRVGEAPTEEPR